MRHDLPTDNAPADRPAEAKALRREAIGLQRDGRRAEAARLLEQVIARFGTDRDAAVRDQVWRATVSLAFLLDATGRRAEALALLDGILLQADDPPTDDPFALVRAGLLEALWMAEAGQRERSLALLDTTLERASGSTARLVVDAAAQALLLKGRLLRECGDDDAALAALDELATTYGDVSEGQAPAYVTSGMYVRADILTASATSRAAADAWAAVATRAAASPVPGMPYLAIDARMHGAMAQVALGDTHAALRALDAAIAELDGDDDVEARQRIADALGRRSGIHADLGQVDAAVSALDEIVARADDGRAPVLREGVAEALLAKLSLLLRHGRAAEAHEASQALQRLYASERDPGTQPAIGARLLDAAARCRRRGEPAEALDLLHSLAAGIDATAPPDLQALAIRGLLGQAGALAELGRTPQAVAAVETVFAHGEGALAPLEAIAATAAETEAADPAARGALAFALVARAVVLGQAGRREAALAAVDDALARFGPDGAEPTPGFSALLLAARDELLDAEPGPSS